jgi:hypothetical protein
MVLYSPFLTSPLRFTSLPLQEIDAGHPVVGNELKKTYTKSYKNPIGMHIGSIVPIRFKFSVGKACTSREFFSL